MKPPPAAVCRFSARWLCLKEDGRGGDDSTRFCLYLGGLGGGFYGRGQASGGSGNANDMERAGQAIRGMEGN